MPDTGNFGANRPAGKASAGMLDCAAVEQWLAESAEAPLPGTVAEALRAHTAQCPACAEKLAQTARGREWLLLLKQEMLSPPAGLMAKILVRTSHADAAGHDVLPTPAPASGPHPDRAAGSLPVAAGDLPRGSSRGQSGGRGPAPIEDSTPIWQHSSVVLLRRTLLEPRLALVAAMAFFSISLTLNLLGVRVTQLRPADLRPSNVGHAISHQYVETNARVVRYYENLRIVYEVEARVQQLRRAAQAGPAGEQEPAPPKNKSGSSGNSGFLHPHSRQDRMANGQKTPDGTRATPVPVPIVAGPVMDARLRAPIEDAPVLDGVRRDVAYRAPTPGSVGPVRKASVRIGLFQGRIVESAQPAPVFPFAPPATPCSRSSICLLHRSISTQERRLV